MIIEVLKLRNYRNYDLMEVAFSPGFNVITGPNGSGKTNILESVSILSGVRSFRNVHDTDIIQWGKDSYYCSASVGRGDHRIFEIGCVLQSDKVKKRAKIDGKEITSFSDYLGKLLTVVFSPSDINIINGSPDVRRRFFDTILARTDREYLITLTDFRKIVKNRNSVLKTAQSGKADNQELDIWDDLFVSHASVLIKKRLEFMEKFKPVFAGIYSGITSSGEVPVICYTGRNEDVEPENLLKKLRTRRKKDIITGMTGIGPHRDDYAMKYTGNSDFDASGSQGQKRAAAIALRLAECDVLEELTGKRVIIMVDDVFSELDPERRKNLFGVLKRENQVIFTMVEPPKHLMEQSAGIKRFICEKGNVRIDE